jgi:hypothetical protein
MSQSLALYRAFLREAHQLHAPPVRRKLCYNARQLWSFYAGVTDPETLDSLHEEARAAVRVLQWLRALPKARCRLSGRAWASDRG